MAKKKVTKAAELDTTNSLDTTASVQEGVGQLDTTVSKNEEIENDSVQSAEQSQSETGSTQVRGNIKTYNPENVSITLTSTTTDGQTVLSDDVIVGFSDEDKVVIVDATKTTQEAQGGLLEAVAVGEPASEPEKAMEELVRLSEELGMYAEDSPELIATDKEQDSDTIAPSEEDIVTKYDDETAWDNRELGADEAHVQLSDLTIEEVQEALGIEPEIDYTSVEIKGVNFIEAVKSILYAGSLGAIIDPKYRPQLGRVPYSVNVLVPVDMLESYQNKEDMQEYDENVQYNVASVSCLDVGRFVEQLLEVGEQGAVLHPKKATNNFVNYTAAICSLFPFSDSAVIKTKPEKRQYTYKELHEFKMKQLKVIASWYKIRNQPKWLLVQRILTAQRELQENEERNKLGS